MSNRTAISPCGSEDKRPSRTKDVSVALTAQKIQGFGELWVRNKAKYKIHMRNTFLSSEWPKYISHQLQKHSQNIHEPLYLSVIYEYQAMILFKRILQRSPKILNCLPVSSGNYSYAWYHFFSKNYLNSLEIATFCEPFDGRVAI